MILDVNEIIGLNTLLDGEKIWGFPETIDKTESDYVEKTAQKLMSHKSKEIDILLAMLEKYKKAEVYLTINHINAAKTEDGWILLVKENMHYHLIFMAQDILEIIVKKEISLFHKTYECIKEINAEKIDFLEYVKINYKRLGRCVILYRYEKRKLNDFHIVYEIDGRRNVYDCMKRENYRIGDEQLEELIKRYMGTWER